MIHDDFHSSEISTPDMSDLYRNIFRQSSIGIEVYDCKGTLLDANPACFDIFGISDLTVVQKYNLFDSQSLSEDNKELLKRGESVQYDYHFS
ncbi:MAG: PAS domain-containing protein, partial [Fibrobacterota bacterium]